MGTEVVIRGIVAALKRAFPEYKVYTEQIEQGLVYPCFFVGVLKPFEKALMGRRFYRGVNFDIHFFPGDAHVYETGDLLYGVLEFVGTEGELFRGTEMSYELVDNVLHFYVSYNFIVRKYIDAADGMGYLNVNVDAR